MRRQRSDLIYRAEYEPDMARMVKALRVLLDFDPSRREGAAKTNSESNRRLLELSNNNCKGLEK